MNKQKVLQTIFILCLFVILAGSALLEVALQNSYAIPVLSYILMACGVIGAIISELLRRLATPKAVLVEEQKTRGNWESRGVIVDYNILPFIFLSGMVAELYSFVYFSIIYGLLAVFSYFIISYCFFYRFRERNSTFKWDFIFHFGFVLAIPATAFAFAYPQFLYDAGVLNTVGNSREFAYLTIIYLQTGLLISTVITASRSWRTTFLQKAHFGTKEMQTKQTKVLAEIVDEDKKAIFREIFSDMATMREVMIFGQFNFAITCGWSIIDRALSELSNRRTMKEKARALGVLDDDFEMCYTIRNKTVHEGYKPKFNDAFACLEVVNRVITHLRYNETLAV